MVESSLNLLITRAEVRDINFRKDYSGEGYHIQVEIVLYAGAQKVTSMYLTSNADRTDVNFIEYDRTMEKAVESVVKRIKSNANISLQRVGRQLEEVESQ
jgi:hypothetical protein